MLTAQKHIISWIKDKVVGPTNLSWIFPSSAFQVHQCKDKPTIITITIYHVNALLHNKNIVGGWQVVISRKNHKKARRTPAKLYKTSKCPHSESLIKEKTAKRQVTESRTDMSKEEEDH